MAVMLRTHGIAARVVNGFLPGEYNEAAGAYTVRQSDAHSWVEVYFPETNSWVTFDPTPAAGRTEPLRSGLAARLEKYAEAFELMWFQFVVGYDKQEQRTLATSLNKRAFDVGRSVSGFINRIRQTSPNSIRSIVLGLGVLGALLGALVLARRIRRFGWKRGVRIWESKKSREQSLVEFYARLITLLGRRGLKREENETPIEFATATGINEVINVTQLYYRVRFGGQELTRAEIDQLDSALANLGREQ
jgi:protein-glutamine gamma-glutamyltransferase